VSAPPSLAGRAHAVILAAGRGSRLRPFTDTTPKPLLSVAGHPLIAYGLGLLRWHGFEDVVVNVHHLREQIMETLGDGSGHGLRIRYSVEPELLDTGGGIRQAATLLAERFPPREPIVVLNADIISEVPLDLVLASHLESRALATFVLREDPEAARYGVFGIDDTGRIRRFLGRRSTNDRGREPVDLRELMFASVQILAPELVAAMPEGSFSSMHHLYPRLFEHGGAFLGFPYAGRWHVVDTPSDLTSVDESLRRRGLPRFMRS
jgi:mannose-1-phosphate guanylyltransferase